VSVRLADRAATFPPAAIIAVAGTVGSHRAAKRNQSESEAATRQEHQGKRASATFLWFQHLSPVVSPFGADSPHRTFLIGI
jgi:hypothetical protein